LCGWHPHKLVWRLLVVTGPTPQPDELSPSPTVHPDDGVDANDLVLLLLAAPTADATLQAQCPGITRLEKLAFLLERETDFDAVVRIPAEDLHFRPYHYGPYSSELYDAVAFLASIGLVRDRRVDASSRLEVGEEFEGFDWTDLGAGSPTAERPYVERRIELTDKGQLVARLLAERVGSAAVDRITSVKDRFGPLPLRQLLRYVYDTYPQMAAQSRIRDEL
jgi:hypothetical protein